jgi:hypothetical protein
MIIITEFGWPLYNVISELLRFILTFLFIQCKFILVYVYEFCRKLFFIRRKKLISLRFCSECRGRN